MSEELLSPEYLKNLRVSRWSLRVILSFDERKVQVKKHGQTLLIQHVFAEKSTMQKMESPTKTFILYRRQMLQLLKTTKPVFEQLAIELPCLMGFRAAEVATWRAEYIDFQNGDSYVYDCKKKRLFKVPLNREVAKHAEILLNGRSDGFVLQGRTWHKKVEKPAEVSRKQEVENVQSGSRTTTVDDAGLIETLPRQSSQQAQQPFKAESPLTPTAIWCIWHKWTKQTALPHEISPLTGRRFFAAEWYYQQKLSLVTLQMILRHSHFETTVRYVHGLVFYEDLKRDYHNFENVLKREASLEVKTT